MVKNKFFLFFILLCLFGLLGSEFFIKTYIIWIDLLQDFGFIILSIIIYYFHNKTFIVKKRDILGEEKLELDFMKEEIKQLKEKNKTLESAIEKLMK